MNKDVKLTVGQEVVVAILKVQNKAKKAIDLKNDVTAVLMEGISSGIPSFALLTKISWVFGSFADSTYTEESDFDFYIIVHDAVSDIPAETTKAYKSIRKVEQRPVDIVVGTVSRFEAKMRCIEKDRFCMTQKITEQYANEI